MLQDSNNFESLELTEQGPLSRHAKCSSVCLMQLIDCLLMLTLNPAPALVDDYEAKIKVRNCMKFILCAHREEVHCVDEYYRKYPPMCSIFLMNTCICYILCFHIQICAFLVLFGDFTERDHEERRA